MMAVCRAARFMSCALVLSIFTPHLASARGAPDETDLQCLAKAIYFEARGESEKGQLAVGRVVLNRVESETYPDTICDVVYQGSHKRNACQFSFACDGEPDVAKEKKAWREAETLARRLVACDPPCQKGPDWQGPLWTSTHYHADYVNPRWAKKLHHTGTIGRHIFYALA
jgi:spore germination cell wall hydrolase CwlJ-like protein